MLVSTQKHVHTHTQHNTTKKQRVRVYTSTVMFVNSSSDDLLKVSVTIIILYEIR